MSPLLAEALERVAHLTEAEQDAVAARIIEAIADDEAWKQRLSHCPQSVRDFASEALQEASQGQTRPLSDLPG